MTSDKPTFDCQVGTPLRWLDRRSLFRLVRPVVWNERWRLGPGLLNQCGLEPVVPKIGVFRDDDLETLGILFAKASEHLE